MMCRLRGTPDESHAHCLKEKCPGLTRSKGECRGLQSPGRVGPTIYVRGPPWAGPRGPGREPVHVQRTRLKRRGYIGTVKHTPM